MDNRDDILKELQQIAPKLSALSKVNLYTVPTGYFDELKPSLLKISTENAREESLLQNSFLSTIEKPAVSVSDLPDGYFNNFAANMLQKIQQDELAEIAPVLAGLQKVNLYTAPQGYFEKLPTSLLNKAIVNEKPVSSTPLWLITLNTALDEIVASIFRPRYAVAFAGIATVLIIVSLSLFKPKPACADAMCQLEKGLAGVSDEEIMMYINDNAHDFDAGMITEQIDEASLEQVNVNDADFNQQLDEFIQNEFDENDLKEMI